MPEGRLPSLASLRLGEGVVLGAKDADALQIISETFLGVGAEAAAQCSDDCSIGLRHARTGELLGVRDRWGVHPFYYTFRPGVFFAFASEVEPLLTLPGMARRLNQLKAAIYLCGPGTDALDATMTFFEDVHRLPPGHYLVATPAGVSVRRYVSYAGAEEFARESPAELSEELLQRLRRAVRRRMAGAGLLLSGGLKSAAVAALAAETAGATQRLPCWSFVPYDAPGWRWPDDPRPTIGELAQRWPLDLHTVGWADSRMISQGEYYPEVRQQPRWFYIRDDEAAAMSEAERAGLTALMTGMGGQWLPIFQRPPGIAGAALKAGAWRSVLVDAAQGRRRTVRELARLVRYDLLVPALPAWVRRRFPEIARSRGRLAVRVERREVILDSFLRETGAQDWLREKLSELDRDFRENALQDLWRGGLQLHLENWALLGRRHGLEFRYPFLDTEVVDFCLRLPARYHLEGDPQRVLREALAGLLPETIRQRTRRMAPIVDWPYRKLQLQALQRERLAVLERHPLLASMVDFHSIRRALERFPDEVTLQQALATGGLEAAARLLNPGGVTTHVEYYWSFARFLDRNGFC